MPSYPRITQVTNVFQAPQTFDNSIKVNGLDMRPFVRKVGDDTLAGFDLKIDGVWKTVHTVENPEPSNA